MISIEISHHETFAAEEFEEQEVIPTFDEPGGDGLHVVKVGIPPDMLTNQSMTSSLNNTTSEPTHQNYDQFSVVKEEATLDKLSKDPVSDSMINQKKSKLFFILAGGNLTTVAPTVAPTTTTTSKMDTVKTILAKRRRRHKRQVGLDLNDIANKGWAYQHTTPADNSSTGAEDDSFQVISEADRDNARDAQTKTILIFTGSVLLTVLMFSGITFCFLRDPKACIVAFGTGCPCLLVVIPCVMKCLDKYLNPAKIVKENLNRYMPGVIIHEDGTIEKYDASPEEIECITEIVQEVMGI
ncbi:uncharacterized protein LOC110449110 isoform X2 [Mizuhopecten yessoensis]|uniref:Uncharacterized protein n=2 Tax=Mizuhopecten yessoensis TaxID=6573 RepID=A0A210QRW1_MIZYE|nr:uncharacterized protein LOC110449110 isoform X2 [Mizuhopecten yessoensis]OWF51470.1 hypothetical protein KP79_PYT23093 [Mizuhopecten yessoensis]